MRLLLSLLVLASSACQVRNVALPSPLMDPHDNAALPATPPAERSLIVFVRPSELGYNAQAVVYEDDQMLGVVMRYARIVHETTPGMHRYMVVSEAADFFDAELEAGKMYFVEVTPRVGAWRARFSLLPITPTGPEWANLHQWLDESRLETPNALAWEWSRDNQPSVTAKKEKYLPVWLQKPDRPRLAPADGVARP